MNFEKELRQVRSRIDGIPAEVLKLEKQIGDARRERAELANKTVELRGARGIALADGLPDVSLTSEIRRLSEAEELLDDKIVGLERKRNNLEGQVAPLREEEGRLKIEVAREKLRPLVDAYNAQGAAMAKTVRDLFLTCSLFGIPFGGAGILQTSSPEFIQSPYGLKICGLSIDEAPKDIFRLDILEYEVRQEYQRRIDAGTTSSYEDVLRGFLNEKLKV